MASELFKNINVFNKEKEVKIKMLLFAAFVKYFKR